MSGKLTISGFVSNDVANFKMQGGSKTSIDTKKEYESLSSYLHGERSSEFSSDDKLYIKGLMIECASKLNAAYYAGQAKKIVEDNDDDYNKSEFDKLFGTASIEGNVNAYNIIEVLDSFERLYDFIDGVEDQNSCDFKSSFIQICHLVSQRLQLMVEYGTITQDDSRYTKTMQALAEIKGVLDDNPSWLSEMQEREITKMFGVVIRELKGSSVYNGVSFEATYVKNVYRDSGYFSMERCASAFLERMKQNCTSSRQAAFKQFLGDGSLKNPGIISATNIIEFFDCMGFRLEEFIINTADMGLGSNIEAMLSIINLLEERLEIVSSGIISKQSEKYATAKGHLEQIKSYLRSGFAGNASNIAAEITNFVTLMRGYTGTDSIWYTTSPKELATCVLNGTYYEYDDDLNKQKFDYLFGTDYIDVGKSSTTVNSPINHVNIVRVLDVLVTNGELGDFVNGVEDQNSGDNTISMQRVLDLLTAHLELLVKNGKVEKDGAFVNKINDNIKNIQMYMNNDFYTNEVRIANLLKLIVKDLKSKDK